MTIEILVGPIGSGKTTYARRRAREGALCVTHDGLCNMLHMPSGGPGYEPGLRAMYRGMEESLATYILDAGRPCIVDRTHLTRESRRRWLDYGRRRSEPMMAVVFPIASPILHAVRRFRADARGRTLAEWIAVAGHHAAQALAEPYDEAEGFARTIRIKGDPGTPGTPGA